MQYFCPDSKYPPNSLPSINSQIIMTFDVFYGEKLWLNAAPLKSGAGVHYYGGCSENIAKFEKIFIDYSVCEQNIRVNGPRSTSLRIEAYTTQIF